MDVNWSSLVLEPTWMKHLDLLALKRFGQQGLAEEASAYVLEKISDDDWAICQRYSGKAKPQTYLHTLTNNLLEEFSRKRFGRPRPPQWLQREGTIWIRLWKMLCLERQSHPSIVDQLISTGQRSAEFIHETIRTIKSRIPHCGDTPREISDHQTDDSTHEQSTDSIEQSLNNHELEDSLYLIHQLLLGNKCPSNISTTSQQFTEKKWKKLQQQFELTAEERILLKMVYQDGLKMNVIAKALSIPSYQPGRILKGIHIRLQEAFNEAGLAFNELLTTIDEYS